MATEAFAVMREGMKGKAGIGKLALYGREYLVAVQPREKGLVMYTMRHANEVRSMDNIEELDDVPAKIKPDEIKLAKQVIGNFEGEFNLPEYRDEYQEELQRIIDAKIAGEEVVATAEETPPKVVNLMDALRQSLDRVSTGQEEGGEGGVREAGEGRAEEARRAVGTARLRPASSPAPRYCSKICSRTHCADEPWPHLIFELARAVAALDVDAPLPGLGSLGVIVSTAPRHAELLHRGARNPFHILLFQRASARHACEGALLASRTPLWIDRRIRTGRSAAIWGG